ncbi:MAG TPA: zinc ribbon domain-containing protein [Candidatus Nitrosotenuis sp.]|jgi:hypothetical protein|nr:zinc ribbon domain-containing protein [Candidatus Nitrosotenuis sp.]
MVTENEPTPAAQTNRFIAVCRDVLAGRRHPDELRVLLGERQEGLSKAREDLLARAQAEGAEFLQGFRDELDTVLEHFELYEKALEEISAYFVDRRPEHIENGVQALIEVTPKLLGAMDNYEAKYVVTGPTRFPVLNILMKVVPAVREGRFSKDDFASMLKGAVDFFSKAVAEIDASPMKDQPGIPQRRQACLDMVAAVSEMQKYLEDGDPAHLDRGLGMVEKAQEDTDESFRIYQQAAFYEGPTPSPFVNVVIRAAEGFKTGLYPADILSQALDWLEAQVRKVRATVEETADSPTSSVVIQEELPRTMEAFDQHEEAIADLRSCLADPVPERIDAALERLKAAVEKLHQSQQVYLQVGEREGKIVCPRCGRPNPPESRSCEQCGMVLPRLTEGAAAGVSSTFEWREASPVSLGEEQEMVMTTHLKRIFDACEAIYANQISPEEFAEVLDWAEGLLDAGARKLAELPHPNPSMVAPEEREEFEQQSRLADDARDMLASAIEDFRAGLGQMRAYLEDPDRDHLVNGIRAVWEAGQRMYQVQKMGEAVERMERGASTPAAAAGGSAGPEEGPPDDASPGESPDQDRVDLR